MKEYICDLNSLPRFGQIFGDEGNNAITKSQYHFLAGMRVKANLI